MKSKHGSAALAVMFLVLLITGCGGGGGGGAAPAAPTGVTATAGHGEVSIGWPSVAGATSYNIYWSATTGVTKATGTKVADVTSPNIVTGLTNGTTYYFVVTAVNAIGESADSSEVSATPTLAPPVAPTGVTATAGHGEATISWPAVAGAASYNIYWSTTTGVTKATGNKLTGVVSPSIVPGLTNGTPYYFVVTAVNVSGEGPESNEVSAAPTPAPPPPAPTNVTAAAGPTQATISWAPVTGATSYKIYHSTTAGVTKATGTSVPGVIAASPKVVTGLINGTTYYFVVTAVNADGESADSSPVVSATPTPATAPSPPTGVSAVKGPGQATISWDNVTGATSYNIYYSLTSGVTKATGTKVAGITASPRIVTPLIRGSLYFFVVTAVNGIGESAESSEVSALPDPPTPTFSQADLTGVWNILVLQSGTDNGWYRVTGTVSDAGDTSVVSTDNGGNITAPWSTFAPQLSITSSGVVTEGAGGNLSFFGKMTTSKTLIVGTSTRGGTTVALHIFVKRVAGVTYSSTDLEDKTFAWNKIISGAGYWEKAAGTIDNGVMTLSSAEDSSGVLSPPSPYSTITIDATGVVTLGREPLFWGVMSPDKKIIVGASTSEPYSLSIYQMRGQTYTQADLAGTSTVFTFFAAPASSWNHATWLTNVTGGVTGSDWLGSASGTTPLLTSWGLTIDPPGGGEVTTSGDFVSNGGWMSFGKELVVFVGGNAPGDSFMTIKVQ